MKIFKYDTILTETDLCDRKNEIERLLSIIKRNGRLVLYSIRRMGKTSLITICSQKYQDAKPKTFVLYVDLNEVISMEDVSSCFRVQFEQSLKEQIPIQRAKDIINKILSKIRITFPGNIELSYEKYIQQNPKEYMLQLFRELNEISKKSKILLIIDEFQGIEKLKDVQAFLRREIQNLKNAAIIIAGSNQRLLYRIFNDKKNPFYSFGEDMELTPIPIDEYLPYINDRFSYRNLSISKSAAKYLLEKMNNIPNYTNELGAWIVDNYENMEIIEEQIDAIIISLVQSKRGRYESALYGYTKNQKKFIRAVAKKGFVKNYSGKEMQELSSLSATELLRVKRELEDCPLLSLDTQNQLFIIDPFFRKFLELV